MLLALVRIIVGAGVVLVTVVMIVVGAVTQQQRGPTLLDLVITVGIIAVAVLLFLGIGAIESRRAPRARHASDTPPAAVQVRPLLSAPARSVEDVTRDGAAERAIARRAAMVLPHPDDVPLPRPTPAPHAEPAPAAVVPATGIPAVTSSVPAAMPEITASAPTELQWIVLGPDDRPMPEPAVAPAIPDDPIAIADDPIDLARQAVAIPDEPVTAPGIAADEEPTTGPTFFELPAMPEVASETFDDAVAEDEVARYREQALALVARAATVMPVELPDDPAPSVATAAVPMENDGAAPTENDAAVPSELDALVRALDALRIVEPTLPEDPALAPSAPLEEPQAIVGDATPRSAPARRRRIFRRREVSLRVDLDADRLATLLRSLEQPKLDAGGPGLVVIPGGRSAPRAN